MNIMLVDKCTSSCSYCFASSEMELNKKMISLSRESIKKIIHLISNSGDMFTVNLLGGEPFLYEDLNYILKELNLLNNFYSATIFTGGIFSNLKFEDIKKFNKNTSILFNINEQVDYRNENEYKKILTNIEKCFEYGFKVNIGFNIYRKDFNYKEIIDLAVGYGINTLRWSIAYPELTKNDYIKILSPIDYKLINTRVVDFLQYAYENNVIAYLDCPISKCFFTDEQIGKLYKIQKETVTRIGRCNPVIDVDPQLNVFRCFALSSLEKKKLTDFNSFEEIVNFYTEHIDEKLGPTQVFQECVSCDFAYDKSCVGGCIVHSQSSLDKIITKEEIIQNIYNSTNNEDIDKYLNMLELHKDAVSLILSSKLNFNKGNKTKAILLSRKAINMAKSDDVQEMAHKNFLELINNNIR